MATLNKVFLIGNLTRDPEIRHTTSGTSVAQFGLAVNRKFKGGDGQQKEEVAFIDIEVWARLAEIANEYLSKGSPVLVEGRLKLDSWENKQGEKRSKLRVVGENIQFLGSGKKKTQEQILSDEPTIDEIKALDTTDDDLPF